MQLWLLAATRKMFTIMETYVFLPPSLVLCSKRFGGISRGISLLWRALNNSMALCINGTPPAP
jgi:hypothetical protein